MCKRAPISARVVTYLRIVASQVVRARQSGPYAALAVCKLVSSSIALGRKYALVGASPLPFLY